MPEEAWNDTPYGKSVSLPSEICGKRSFGLTNDERECPPTAHYLVTTASRHGTPAGVSNTFSGISPLGRGFPGHGGTRFETYLSVTREPPLMAESEEWYGVTSRSRGCAP